MFNCYHILFDSILSQSNDSIIVHENDIDMTWMRMKFQQQDHASMRRNDVHSNNTM